MTQQEEAFLVLVAVWFSPGQYRALDGGLSSSDL